MSAVVYPTRNGLLELLGQSQIYYYLLGLTRKYKITLINFENLKILATMCGWPVRADFYTNGEHFYLGESKRSHTSASQRFVPKSVETRDSETVFN